MIVTVTLNPGPDRTLAVRRIEYDKVLRATSLRLDWGGKGLNVSRALRVMGVPSIVTGFAGGYAGQMITDGLEALGIATDFVPIEGETRTNTVILEEGTDRYVKVNEAGPSVTLGEMAQFEEKASAIVRPGDIWIIGGRPPRGVLAEAYRRIVELLQHGGARVFLDTSGDYLVQGCLARPFLVKPNVAEASQFVAGASRSQSSAPVQDICGAVREAAQGLGVWEPVACFLGHGVSMVALSMGPDGLLLASHNAAVWARPPQVRAPNPTGAGDALMAGLALGLDRGLPLAEVARWAVAAGTASAMRRNVGFDDMKEVEALLPQVTVA